MIDILKKTIEMYKEEGKEIVKFLYENPELGNEEFKAMQILSNKLEKEGFTVEREFIIPTGFIGKYDSKKEGPIIAYLCEYDALPEVGHGCAHNLIAGIGLLAGIALKSVIDELGGQVWVVGTPAEENFGGKVSMSQAGVFDKVDVAMMIHPSTFNGVGGRTNAINPLKFEFFGKNAHGCQPQAGKSALDAAVLTYTSISMMRQYVKANTYIHGVINNGGEAANVIPAYSSMEYYFRGDTMKYVEELSEKATKCAEAAALASGCELKVSVYECPYDDFNINYTLCDLLKNKYSSLGIENIEPVQEDPRGSSDIGSVSYVCPALHGYIKIAPDTISGHSKGMAEATISSQGAQALVDGALALSLIGVDCLSKPEIIQQIKEEFKNSL